VRLASTLFALSLASPLLAQSMPQAALKAKKVVVLNDTHSFAVEQGAEAQLKQWGRMTVVGDIDGADLVLSFTKKAGHSTQSTQKESADGKPNEYGFSVSSESTVEMSASTRDGFAPFYKTYTHSEKAQAGRDCVSAFINAWLDAQRAAAER
jgi:hypothetical protein